MSSDLLPAASAIRRNELRQRETLAAPLQSRFASPEVEGWELLRRYVAAVFRYKWLLVAMLLGGAGASIAVTRFLHPMYDVQATIWLATQTPETRTAGPFRAHELVNTSAWPDLLTSYVIL